MTDTAHHPSVQVEDGNEAVRIKQEIAELGPWFHNLHLPGGIETEPHHPLGDFPMNKWNCLSPHIPEDLTGWTALDIGCNAGFYSIELAKRGAQVTSIDIDEHYLLQARWAARQFGVEKQINFKRMQVYDLAHIEESYDLVFFMGVFYHLRYPMLGLDIVTEKVKRLLVFQTLTMPGDEVYEDTEGLQIDHREPMREPGWPKMAFIEHRLAGDPTNWWAPNHAGVEAILRASGMRVLVRPGHEIYICEPDPEHPSVTTTWNRQEILAATGRPWQQADGSEATSND